MQAVFGYFVALDVVDMILDREGTAHETFVIFEEFEKELFEGNWTLQGSFYFN
jgi:hypothetical protein